VALWLKGTLAGGRERAPQPREADLLYAAIVTTMPGFVSGSGGRGHRSVMNVVFRLPSEEL